MANTYKNIVIVPNIGSNIADPRIVFSGANNTVDTDITLSVNPSTNGTLSIDGDRQLFSVTNSMVGIHFSVNDVNGIPNIEITDSGIIRLAQYSGNVQILGGQASTSNTTGELQVTGGVGITGNVYADGVYDGGIELLTYFLGVDNTQNTRIQSIETINTNQNTSITAVNQFAASAYAHANNAFNSSNTFASFEAGVDASQNTRIQSIETINTNQNTSISIIQGVDLTQNTNITAVNNFAVSAFNQANTANTRAFNTVLKSGDTMTGALNISSALVGTTWGNGALNINGNIVGNNAIYFGGTASFGTANGSNKFSNSLISAIGNSTSYAQAVLQNGNSGVGSSTDFVATADNGTDSDTFIDMGINSSSYNQAGFELTGPNDGYLYVYGNTATGGGNLVLSTFTPKDIVFSLNGQNVASEYVRIQHNTGLRLKNLPLTFADNTSQNTAAAPANYTQSAFNTANGANGLAAGAYNQANVTIGVDATQNTNITAVNNFAQSAYNTANGANGLAAGAYNTANVIIGVNTTQNTNITAVSQLAQSAYNYANTINSFGIISVSGQPQVIANIADASLVFVAGSGMAITTVGTSNTITFASTSTGGSIAIGNEVSNSSIFYPLLSNVTSGTMSTANTSSTKLYYQPSTGILNATTFNSLSDETQKTNIQIISNALEITEQLRGVTFNFKENGILSAGLIAQDVEKYLPQLISIGEHGKSLNYDGVIGVLVEAIKELSQRVKDLEGR